MQSNPKAIAAVPVKTVVLRGSLSEKHRANRAVAAVIQTVIQTVTRANVMAVNAQLEKTLQIVSRLCRQFSLRFRIKYRSLAYPFRMCLGCKPIFLRPQRFVGLAPLVSEPHPRPVRFCHDFGVRPVAACNGMRLGQNSPAVTI